MLVVGLTGGIASGKSTVSTLLREEHHLPLIDLDVLAREVVKPGSATLARLRSTFGDGIISSKDGTLDRPALGRIIFNDAKQRNTLNGIMHPAIRKLMAWKLLRCWLAGEKVVIVDAPLLVEAGLWRFAGKIILVYCSEQIQLQRLLARAGPDADPEDARARIASQRPLSSKLPYADYVLDNSGGRAELVRQVRETVGKIQRNSGGWSWLACWLIPPFGILKAGLTLLYRLYYKKIGQEKKSRKSKL